MSNSWLDELPWAVESAPKSSRRSSTRRHADTSMWQSAPDLNFTMPEKGGDDFLSFDEPDFSKSAANLNFDFNAEPDEDDYNFDNKTHQSDFAVSPRVKVRASRLSSNMHDKEKEIKDLFSQWKQKTSAFPDVSPSSPSKSPTRVIVKSGRNNKSLMKLQTCPPTFADGECHPNSPNRSPTKRKKKVAVKLKARDLNLSKSKQEEIEQMFWQWKEKAHEPAPSSSGQHATTSDHRWYDEGVSPNRPKPTMRQSSINDDEIEVQKEKIKPLQASFREKPHPMRRSRSTGRQQHDAQNTERSVTSTRDKSRSREKSKSRSPGRGERSPRDRSKSRTVRRHRSSSRDGTEEPARNASRSSSFEGRPKSRSRSVSDEERPKSRSRSTSGEGRHKSRSRSRSARESANEHHCRDEHADSTEPKRRSKSTNRRPSYVRRVASSDSMDSTVCCSSIDSDRRPGQKRSSSEDQATFPL